MTFRALLPDNISVYVNSCTAALVRPTGQLADGVPARVGGGSTNQDTKQTDVAGTR